MTSGRPLGAKRGHCRPPWNCVVIGKKRPFATGLNRRSQWRLAWHGSAAVQALAHITPQYDQGVAAFIEKRPPQFD
jgi:hypothetical protein